MQSRGGQGKSQDSGKGQQEVRLPKQFNSDWNTVIEEKENANLFFRIFSAPKQARTDSHSTILTKNKAKVRR